MSNHAIRIFTISTASFLLVLSLGRCSPISPSISKAQLQAGSAEDKNNSGPTTTVFHSDSLQILSTPVRTVDDESFQAEIRKFKSITLTALQVEELRTYQKTLLKGVNPSANQTILLSVSLPKGMLVGSSGLEGMLKGVSEGAIELSISRSLDGDLDFVIPQIQGAAVVSLTLASQPE